MIWAAVFAPHLSAQSSASYSNSYYINKYGLSVESSATATYTGHGRLVKPRLYVKCAGFLSRQGEALFRQVTRPRVLSLADVRHM